jgi:hypothetical protein
VKRTALIKKVRAAARAAGLAFEVTGGGDHDKVVVGTHEVALPRHTEINELTAQAIFKRLEKELGEDWWR